MGLRGPEPRSGNASFPDSPDDDELQRGARRPAMRRHGASARCHHLLAGLLLVTLARSAGAAAAPPRLPTYSVGSVLIAPGNLTLEFPLFGDLRGQVGLTLLPQGTYEDRNPFAYLSGVFPYAWIHYDAVRNLRLSAGYQALWTLAVTPVGIPSGREDRYILRARYQEPLGASALYELAQLDFRSFDDARGVHQFVLGPRFRVGQGFNLDAARINSLSLFEEVGFRFADPSYTKRKFDFFRAFVGYTWTSRHGIFVTFGVIGQISLNPPGTGISIFYGPLLSLAYRISPRVSAAPPEPQAPDIR
jgi:hypothetical protein